MKKLCEEKGGDLDNEREQIKTRHLKKDTQKSFEKGWRKPERRAIEPTKKDYNQDYSYNRIVKMKGVTKKIDKAWKKKRALMMHCNLRSIAG